MFAVSTSHPLTPVSVSLGFAITLLRFERSRVQARVQMARPPLCGQRII